MTIRFDTIDKRVRKLKTTWLVLIYNKLLCCIAKVYPAVSFSAHEKKKYM